MILKIVFLSIPSSYTLVIVWPTIPGYFLLMRLFLINFQEFFMSKLSSGILRINLAMEGIIKDSIAYSLW